MPPSTKLELERIAAARAARALGSLCARVLSDRAAAAGVSTRQQRRAAARQFVRRHRRDPVYLQWVLRSATAGSALAVALLGLTAPASAEIPTFAAFAPDPLAGHDVGSQSKPALGDLDGDADLDLVAGELGGTLHYFENTGDAASAAFVARTGGANPLAGHDVGDHSAPSLGDLDGDGDLDLVVGDLAGTFSYFENTGSATGAAFVPRSGAANPLDGEDAGDRTVPALGDLDGDGDLDLVVATFWSGLEYFENTGNASSPAFVARLGSDNPFGTVESNFTSASIGDPDGDGDLDVGGGFSNGTSRVIENLGNAAIPLMRTSSLIGHDVGSYAASALGDLDRDGDPDLVSGTLAGGFVSFENRRSGVVPQTIPFNPLGTDVGARTAPALADLDGDGDLDLLAGVSDLVGRDFLHFENIGSAAEPVFAVRTGGVSPLIAAYYPVPAFGDLDGDGDLDLVAGGYGPDTFFYFENTGSATNPIFAARTGAADPIPPIGCAYCFAAPTLGDLDGDGDLDLVASVGGGGVSTSFVYFQNTGSAAIPAFLRRTGTANPLNGFSHLYSAPALGDLDGDGDLDLLSGEVDGRFRYFQNTGFPFFAGFVERTGGANPLAGQDVGDSAFPSLGDLDDDGDLDLVSGAWSGTFVTLENVGSGSPVFEPCLFVGPLTGVDIGALSGPAFADLDRDGDPDLVVGDDSGALSFYENTGVATAATFAARTGEANPLDGQDVGDAARPSVADLDADGDFDLLVGTSAGVLEYFENTGDATLPLFAAPLADPFGLLGSAAGASAPSFGDLDADGDLDLVVGNALGNFAYFENSGSRTTPAFAQRTGAANPLAGIDLGDDTTPALADFDRDGDLDLVAGRLDGTFATFRNRGTTSTPVFAQTGGAVPDPLDGVDVGTSSSPAAVDLDADGDVDLVAGTGDGTFAIHYVPEPGRGALLGAALGLLSALVRRSSNARSSSSGASRSARVRANSNVARRATS